MLRVRFLLTACAAILLAGCASRGTVDQAFDDPFATTEVVITEPTYGLDAKTPFWDQVVSQFGVENLPRNIVEAQLNRYLKDRVQTQRMLLRSEKYIYYIFTETQKRGMPSEIALLPFVESAFKPHAVSRSKAVGLWQFIASTGDIFSLERSHWRDDRRDIVESTRAALDYLEKLHGLFGNWQLALAAYNCGEGHVSRAIARNRARGLPTGYLDLTLPMETRQYVPKLLAVRDLIKNASSLDFVLPDIAMRPYFVKIHKNRDFDLETAALLAETDLETFRELNPSFARPVALAAHEKTLLVPSSKARIFADNLLTWERSGRALSTWQTHTVRKGETVKTVAARFGMTENEFRRANAMSASARLTVGANVLVRGRFAKDITTTQAKVPSAVYEPPKGQYFRHVVRRGETLSRIASRYGVTVRSLRSWNRLSSKSVIRPGQRLRIWLANAPATQKTSSKVVRYTVRSGDTVFSIAKRYRVSISAIKRANRMKTFDIRPGQKLIIPR